MLHHLTQTHHLATVIINTATPSTTPGGGGVPAKTAAPAAAEAAARPPHDEPTLLTSTNASAGATFPTPTPTPTQAASIFASSSSLRPSLAYSLPMHVDLHLVFTRLPRSGQDAQALRRHMGGYKDDAGGWGGGLDGSGVGMGAGTVLGASRNGGGISKSGNLNVSQRVGMVDVCEVVQDRGGALLGRWAGFAVAGENAELLMEVETKA